MFGRSPWRWTMGYLVPLSVPVALTHLVCRSSLGLGFVSLLFNCRERCRAQIVSFGGGCCDWFCKLVGVFPCSFDRLHGYHSIACSLGSAELGRRLGVCASVYYFTESRVRTYSVSSYYYVTKLGDLKENTHTPVGSKNHPRSELCLEL